jgi:hypothetical protein
VKPAPTMATASMANTGTTVTERNTAMATVMAMDKRNN